MKANKAPEQYIPKSAVVAEIERRYETNIIGAHSVFRNGKIEAFREVKDFLDTLEVKEVYVSNPRFPHLKDIIDKVFGAGNLEFWEYDDAEQLVLLAKDEVISQVCVAAGMKKPYKDGNQWCILKGENIQEGICGFGDNIEDALIDFLGNIPKISPTPLEVKEVDLDNFIKEEFNKYSCVDGYGQLSVSYNMAEFYGMIKRLTKAQKGE